MLVTLADHRMFLSIHGVNIRLYTDSSFLIEAASHLLGHFDCRESPQASALEVALTAVEQRGQVPLQIPCSAKRLYQGSGIPKGDVETTTWRCDIFADGARLIADFHDEGLITIDGTTNSVKGWIVRPERMSLDVRASFVHFAIVELAKRGGLFTLHATALERDGQGVLIPGFSGRGMCFHPSAEWLSSAGFEPERAGTVEICNADDYLQWRAEQPMMVLHEMAHAYHCVIGFDRADVRAAFAQALGAGRYERVHHALRDPGATERAYALTNEREYFAELTEAWFGRNDMEPFTRAQLLEFDPRGAALVERLWGLSGGDLAAAREGAQPPPPGALRAAGPGAAR